MKTLIVLVGVLTAVAAFAFDEDLLSEAKKKKYVTEVRPTMVQCYGSSSNFRQWHTLRLEEVDGKIQFVLRAFPNDVRPDLNDPIKEKPLWEKRFELKKARTVNMYADKADNENYPDIRSLKITGYGPEPEVVDGIRGDQDFMSLSMLPDRLQQEGSISTLVLRTVGYDKRMDQVVSVQSQFDWGCRADFVAR